MTTLLIGGTGNLGSCILKSNLFDNIIAPKRKQFDLTKPRTMKRFFKKNKIDNVIYCAGMARIKECEENHLKSMKVNVKGTTNLMNVLPDKNMRFIYISSDGIYSGTKGNYSEDGMTIPYSYYGWTKLYAESYVGMLSNFCIIRTSFFNPERIDFKDAPTDAYTSKMCIKSLVKNISIMLNHNFVGTINIGNKKKSLYQIYKKYNPKLKKCKRKDIPDVIAKDSSMDCSLWERIKK